ncbi:FAD-dependent oxidoreductase [Bacteroides sp. BFG-551]|nr:FAD-dependent oxidoreductase [Bacteroides sp. BFG-551]
MKRIYILGFLLIISWNLFAQNSFDLVIVGGNPGGIMTAIAAARQGKTSVDPERTNHLGGLPANGLGATDIATRKATTGLFAEFTKKVKQYYIKHYGENSRQVEDCSDGFHFEPSVAAFIYQEMLNEHKDKITVLLMRQFDTTYQNINVKNGHIENISVLNRENGRKELYQGKIFVDATYEGDLGAAAGVPFRVGRESKEEYGEPGAGRTYEYWKSQPSEDSTGESDNAIQAYNYRLCLTNNPENQIPFPKPESYNRDEYISLIEDVWTGKNTQKIMSKVTNEMMEENRRHIAQGNRTKLPGDNWGIKKLSSLVKLPNQKVDGNNQHAAFLSTDLPEENWPWPTSSWEWRDKFAKRLKDYTLGLFRFAQHDPALPEHFRKDIAKWGLAKDEYQDNENFPRQVYVREGRRFEGVYFFTAKDALPVEQGKRPPLHPHSVTASHYALDSHAARKRETGRVHLDGFISYPTAVYTVPLGVILPRNIDNLLLPVPVSGSHIGFSTLRMEPCWMALGQAAGITASLAIDCRVSVRDIDTTMLQDLLIRQKATRVYYRDIKPEDANFPLVQYMGLRGYLPEWEANLQDAIDNETLRKWSKLCGHSLQATPGITPGIEVLQQIYDQIFL